MRLLVLLAVMVFPGLVFGQNNVYQPLQKGCIWKYHGIDSSYERDFNTGEFSWTVKNITLRIEVLKDTLMNYGRDVKLYRRSNFGDGVNGTFYHWRLLNDTLFSGAESDIEPLKPVDWFFFDHLGGIPGDSFLVQDAGYRLEKLDTLLVFPSETVTTPNGTFACKVTEFRGSNRRDWFKILHEWGGVIRTYRAANIGIVKKTTWYYNDYKKLSRIDFMIDSMYIPPMSSVTVPEKNLRIVKNTINEREKWFNIAGQQLAYVKQPERLLVNNGGRKYLTMIRYNEVEDRKEN